MVKAIMDVEEEIKLADSVLSMRSSLPKEEVTTIHDVSDGETLSALNYETDMYMVRHVLWASKRGALGESAVVLLSEEKDVLIDRIVLAAPLVRVGSAMYAPLLCDDVELKVGIKQTAREHYGCVLEKELRRCMEWCITSPKEFGVIATSRRQTGLLAGYGLVVSGGLPSLGKRR